MSESIAGALSVGAVFVASPAARFVARKGWERMTGEEPPNHPERRDTSWPQALAWAVVAGTLASIARLIARKGIESITGDPAPA